MSYFDDYKARIQQMGGNSESEALRQNTINFIVNDFTNSPNYKILTFDGNTYDTRVINTDSYKTRDVFFLPGTRINIGVETFVDGYYFLVTDFVYDQIVSKARLTMCTDALRWYDNTGTLKSYKLIGSTISRFNAIEKNEEIVGKSLALAYVQRNVDTNQIIPTQRFILGGKAYEVVGVDNITHVDSHGNGLTQLALTASVLNPNDNMMDGIADNSFLKAKSQDNASMGGNGGALW